MAVECNNYNFPHTEILCEFVKLFEQCVENDKSLISVDEKSDIVLTSGLIKKITSSIKIQCLAGTTGDLEDIVNRMVCGSDGITTEYVSKPKFINNISQYLKSLSEELICEKLSSESNNLNRSDDDLSSKQLQRLQSAIVVTSHSDTDLKISLKDKEEDVLSISDKNLLYTENQSLVDSFNETTYDDCSNSYYSIKKVCSLGSRQQDNLNNADVADEIKYLNDVIKEKNKLECICTNLEDKIKTLEKTSTSLLHEKNSVLSSLNDMAKREVELESGISRLQSELRKSEDNAAVLSRRLSDEQILLKTEKDKNMELQHQIKSSRSEHSAILLELSEYKRENECLRKQIMELEKQVDYLNVQFSTAEKNFQNCQPQLQTLQDKLDTAVFEKQQLEVQMEKSLHQLHQTTVLYEDLEVEYKMLNHQKNLDVSIINPVVKGTPRLLQNKKFGIQTSTPVINAVINENSSDNSFSDFDGISAPSMPPTKSFYKSLKDEMEAEGEFHCDRTGCYSHNSSERSDSNPQLVQKIEKQQEVINELIESITKQCSDDNHCSQYNNNSKSDGSSFPQSPSFEFYTSCTEGDDNGSQMSCDAMDEECSEYSATSSLSICSSLDFCLNSINMLNEEPVIDSPTSKCNIYSSTRVKNSYNNSRAFSGLDLTSDYSTNDLFITADDDKNEDNNENDCNSINNSDCNKLYSNSRTHLKKFCKSIDNSMGDRVCDDRDIMMSTKKILKSTNPLQRLSRVLVNFGMSVFSFTMLSLVTLYYRNYNNSDVASITRTIYRPISYYNLEELLQPFVEFRWHQQPPI